MDDAYVAVPDVAVVVVLELHHLVADAKGQPATNDRRTGRVQGCLKRIVQELRADRAAVHRREDLDVPNGIEGEPTRDPSRDEVDEKAPRLVGVPPIDHEEVR